MTTAAGALTEKKEEKVEKRRALGRGLASLLPGPRAVVPSGESRTATIEPAGSADAGSPHPFPNSVRNDNTSLEPQLAVPSQPLTSANESEVISIQVAEQRSAGNTVSDILIEHIEKNPYQTRYVFDETQLQELADSIKEHGVVQPIVVRPGDDAGRYILVLGERRLRASTLAGKNTIPALVRRLSPQQAAEMTVLENVVREDLNPIEQAHAFRVLSQEFKLTQSQIAQRIGVSRESVANYMRLLRLPEKVMEDVAYGRLSFSEARELLALESPEHMIQMARDIVIKHPTLEQLSVWVKMMNEDLDMPGNAEERQGTARWVDPNVRAAQMEMERTLGMRVRIKDRNGKGKIVIEYSSVDDYERVTTMLRRQ